MFWRNVAPEDGRWFQERYRRNTVLCTKNGFENWDGFEDDLNELIQISFFILDFVGVIKSSFMFTCVVNKPSSIPTIGTIIKRVKLKHNNVFVNKLMMNMRAQINYI